jgi:hypothetical protein
MLMALSTSGADPHEGADGEKIEQGQQIVTGQMDAAAGSRRTDRQFVACPMDVDVARVGIHVSTLIPTGIQSFQPEDAAGDCCLGLTLPCETDWAAALEDSACGPAAADFLSDSVQAEWGAIGSGQLADPEPGSGAAV